MLSFLIKVIKVRYNGLLRLREADRPARLKCLKDECSKCCTLMGGEVTVTDKEARNIPQKLLTLKHSNYVIKSNCDSCALLKKGKCGYYKLRPKSCRDYPWYNIGNTLYYDSGCPGIQFDIDERPNVSTISPIESYFGFLPIIVQRVLLFLIKCW